MHTTQIHCIYTPNMYIPCIDAQTHMYTHDLKKTSDKR